jgi:hypothetical protein
MVLSSAHKLLKLLLLDDTSLTRARSAQCESTCASRIHKAALETFNSFSSPLSKSSSSLPNIDASPLALNRPKRLPTLIKILTGFHENYNNIQPTNHHDNSRKGSIIIAQRSKPQFPKPTNTIQQVATSAAHSVWKQRNSYQIRISGDMPSVNKEWEEALRWIASWDEALLLQQQQGIDMPGLQGLARIDELWQQAYSSVLDDKREDFAAFINDLARLLQTCIDTCIQDDEFDVGLGGDGDASDTALVGNLVKRSIFSWVLGDSLSVPFRIPKRTSGLIFSTAQFLFSSAIRLVAASVAVYAVHCLRIRSPFLTQLHETIVGKDDSSPAWLIEHEKEVELAKKSRHRKNASKKSKRKGSNKKPPSQQQTGKLSFNTAGWKSTTSHASNSRNQQDDSMDDLHSSKQIDDDRWESNYHRPQTYSSKGDNATLSSDARSTKIDQDDTDEHFDGVPSSISISTSSFTMSNNDQSEDRNFSDSAALDEPSPRPSTQLNHTLHRQPRIMTSPPRNMLVPTEEQRNQAAQQLREYQNAQIQRLMHQKKLSQTSQVPPSSEPKSTPITFDPTLRAPANFSSTKVVMPPPGFAQPANAQVNHNIQDDPFLSQNELLLSKLLDDDENIDDILSTDSGVDSFPQESSLDPSAAPFVLEGFDAKNAVSPSQDKKCDSKWGIDRSPSNLLTENNHVKMKGVYGGSVW